MFGITKETQGGAIIAIPAPTIIPANTPDPLYPGGYKFPLAQLINVSFDPEKEIKRDTGNTKEPTLAFTFQDAKKRRATKMFYIIPNQLLPEEYKKEMDSMNQYIKHFWDETIGEDKLPEEGLGTGAKDFAEFFKMIAEAFNSQTREVPASGETPKQVKIFSQIPVYIKQTFYQDRTQFPKFPNVIQRSKDANGKHLECLLSLNPTYDKITATAKPGAGNNNSFVPNAGGNIGGSDFPDDLPDFPA